MLEQYYYYRALLHHNAFLLQVIEFRRYAFRGGRGLYRDASGMMADAAISLTYQDKQAEDDAVYARISIELGRCGRAAIDILPMMSASHAAAHAAYFFHVIRALADYSVSCKRQKRYTYFEAAGRVPRGLFSASSLQQGSYSRLPP